MGSNCYKDSNFFAIVNFELKEIVFVKNVCVSAKYKFTNSYKFNNNRYCMSVSFLSDESCPKGLFLGIETNNEE